VVCQIAERLEAFRIMLTSSIGSKVKLNTTIGSDISAVKVDVSEFELAIINLVVNARDAMPNGGVISITAENVALSPSDTAIGLEGAFVALRVTDTGSGIAPDVLLKVFDPFFTTKEADKGSGLGLSQVHGFAHQSGGTVTIESELGRGTTVTLYLPQAEEELIESGLQSEELVASHGRVLVVEDNPEVADVTVSMLEQLGYEVMAVRDADTALTLIEQQSFDLMVSDIVMAGSMDGIGLARVIREQKPGLAVLLVTGYSNAASYLVGEFVVIRKPFQLAELNRAVARLIAEAKQPPGSNVVRLRAPHRDRT
jgi:CheY-like chemotaxis protein/anti-sigma regulatory factor (Ser/Thr protein kinase)